MKYYNNHIINKYNLGSFNFLYPIPIIILVYNNYKFLSYSLFMYIMLYNILGHIDYFIVYILFCMGTNVAYIIFLLG